MIARKNARLVALMVLSSAFFAIGCDKKETEVTPEAPAPTAAPAPAPAVAEGPELAPEQPSLASNDLPTPEDFEEEAERTVKVDNLEAELDRLEAEITSP
ncbi:MAG TPA: hypothetical protein VLC09_11390 [Polyangiaceae bacterium]|nr:hypothetical protein [Polyangiaceae bacterium]